MLEKGISRASVKHIICTGEMIENYPDDKPFPSGLFYGIWQNQPLHAVIAYDLSASWFGYAHKYSRSSKFMRSISARKLVADIR